MRRTATALLALLTVTAMLVAGPGAALAQDDGNQTVDENATATPSPDENASNESEEDENASVSPGERLSAVIGVQESELEGELGSRAFGLAVARAASDERLAEVVGEEYNETNASVQALERRRAALEASRENGSIGQGEYESRLTVLAAQSHVAQQRANLTANASMGVPSDLLEEQGINVSSIQELKNNAANLTGPEVARIAQSIAGEGVGAGFGDEARADDGDRGEDGDRAANQSEDANQSADEGNQTAADGGNQSESPEADQDANRTDSGDDSSGPGMY